MAKKKKNRAKRGHQVAILIGLHENDAVFWKIYSETIRFHYRLKRGRKRKSQNKKHLYHFHEEIIDILRPIIKKGIRSVILLSPPKEEYSDEFLGLGVKELTQDYIINNDLEFDTEGVWVSRIEDAGKASLGGIDVNDLILKINDEEIRDLEDFSDSTRNLKDSKLDYVQVFLKRQGQTRFVFIKTLLNEKLQ